MFAINVDEIYHQVLCCFATGPTQIFTSPKRYVSLAHKDHVLVVIAGRTVLTMTINSGVQSRRRISG
jgi:hypothetical protein